MTRSPDRPWSIRSRLIRQVLGLVLGAWVAAIALSALVLDQELNELYDRELSSLAASTVLMLDAAEGSVIPRLVGVALDDGERVLRILPEDSPVPDAPWPVLERDGFHDANNWRILRLTAENAVIEVAHSRHLRRGELLEVAAAFLVLLLPMIALLAWSVRRSLGRALQPMQRLAATVAGRSPDDPAPLADQGLPQELRPLASGLNSYIGRIADLREAERHFVANAAHELRTPIAAIRARLDASQVAEARATVPLLDDLVRRIERLLQLARSESGVGLGKGPADLLRVLRLLLEDLARQGGPAVHFDDADLDRLMLPVDPDALAILLRNLLDNAVSHGTGSVRVTVTAAGVLQVENPVSPGAAILVQAFEKGPESQGNGLGMAIIARLADAMGAVVESRVQDGRARVTVRFPAPV